MVATRWARRADRPAVEPLFLASMVVEDAKPDPAAFRRSWDQSFTAGATFRFVVADDERASIVGMCTLHTHYSTFRGAPTLLVEDLFVKDSHRNRGVGSLLLDFIESHAATIRAARIELHVRNDNRARDLYARRGLEEKPYRWMMKALSGFRGQKPLESGRRPAARARPR